MIDATYVRMMAAYNAEMNRRVYAAAARLPEAALREDRGAFFGSILATLNHLAWGDQTWLSRFTGRPHPGVGIPGSVTLYPDFPTLRAVREAVDAEIEAWAETVTPDWLAGELAWHSASLGRELRRPHAMLVVHMFNHQTHHRGQVHAMLTAAGEQTGDTDLPMVWAEV